MKGTTLVGWAGVGGALAIGVVVLTSSRGAVAQPIAFNHNKHVEGLGLSCTICHLYAESGSRATIPNIEVCQMCHSTPLTDSPEERRLVENIRAEEPIPWRKVYRVPDHVFFSHRRHTEVAEIECAACHGEVGNLATPVSRPAVKISMDRCMTCHWAEEASNDCISCHV